MHRVIYVVTDPALIEDILVTRNKAFAKGIGLVDVKSLFGEGLLTSDHEIWRSQRKIVGPHFLNRKIEDYAPLIEDCAVEQVSGWQDGDVPDAYQEMNKLGLRILIRSLFGRDIPGSTEAVRQVVAMLQWTQKNLNHYWPGGQAKFDVAIREFDRFIYGLIDTLRRDPGDGNDLVSTLLRAQRNDPGVTDQLIRDQVATMILAGFETTATAITWTLYLIARHPLVAAKLHEEIDETVARKPLHQAGMRDLPFLTQVICESLRLYPPSQRISRRATEPVSLGGYDFDKGTDFLLPQWAVQRSPRWYEQPEAFLPERWTPEMRAKLPRYAWFPFGGGPRICIGQSMSLREMTIIVAQVASRFDLATPSDEETLPYDGLTLLPPGGSLPLVVRRRANKRRRDSAQMPAMTAAECGGVPS